MYYYFLSFFFHILHGKFNSVLLTGYKVYEKKFFEKNSIYSSGFETDHEITVKLLKNNIEITIKRIIEIGSQIASGLSIAHSLGVIHKDIKPNKYHKYEFNEQEIAMWKNLREKYPNMYEGDVAYEIFHEQYPKLAITF